jgi:hypothetical protein
MIRVLTEVSRFIENRLAQSGGFAALAALPGTGGVQAIDPTSLSFAQLGAEILEKISGYEESAARLKQIVQTSTAGSVSTETSAQTQSAQPIKAASATPDCDYRRGKPGPTNGY